MTDVRAVRLKVTRDTIAELERPVDRSAVLNDISEVLMRHYGYLPLDIRYGAAELAVGHVERSNAEHLERMIDRLQVLEEQRDDE